MARVSKLDSDAILGQHTNSIPKASKILGIGMPRVVTYSSVNADEPSSENRSLNRRCINTALRKQTAFF